MRLNLASFAVLALILAACGGGGTTSASPVVEAKTAAPTSTPAPTPATTAPTPTSTPRPSPTPQNEIVRVSSDADCDRQFVAASADEIKTKLATATVENFPIAWPFDCHGVKFTITLQPFAATATAPAYSILIVKVMEGQTTVKSNAVFQVTVFGAPNSAGEDHWIIAPVATTANAAGVGVFMEVRQGVDFVVDPKVAKFYPGVGEPLFKLSVSSPTMEKYWIGNGHLVLTGTRSGFKTGASISAASFMKAADGKIVYVK